MTGYLLDTAVLGAYLFGRQPAEDLVGAWVENHQAITSAIVICEVTEYMLGCADANERQTELHYLLLNIPALFLNFSVLEHDGKIRRKLRPPYGPGLIGDMDVLIAATAMEGDLTLVTTDRDFTRVEGLSLLLLDRRTFAAISDSTP